MSPALHALRPEQQTLLTALALMAAPRPRTWLLECLDHAVARNDAGQRYTQEQLRELIRELHEQGWIAEASHRLGYWRVAPERYSEVFQACLARDDLPRWSEALLRADAPYAGPMTAYSRMPSAEAAVAQIRLQAFQGATPQVLQQWQTRMPWDVQLADVISAAVTDCVDPALLPRLHPALQRQMLEQGLVALHTAWHASLAIDASTLTAALLQADSSPNTWALRCLFAEHLLLQGRADQLEAVLAPLPTSGDDETAQGWLAAVQALRCGALAAQGDWPQAEAAFDAVLARLKKLSGKRRGLLSQTLGTAYVLSLLAQGTPAHLQKALKFCLGEGGKREPVLDSPYGLIALAIQMRSGEARRDLGWFKPYSRGGHVSPRL